MAVGKSQKKVVKKSDCQSSQKQSLRLQTDSGLNDVQLAVFLKTCKGRSCKDIAKQLGYDTTTSNKPVRSCDLGKVYALFGTAGERASVAQIALSVRKNEFFPQTDVNFLQSRYAVA